MWACGMWACGIWTPVQARSEVVPTIQKATTPIPRGRPGNQPIRADRNIDGTVAIRLVKSKHRNNTFLDNKTRKLILRNKASVVVGRIARAAVLHLNRPLRGFLFLVVVAWRMNVSIQKDSLSLYFSARVLLQRTCPAA